MLTRVPLEHGWTLWPVVLVRAAGFPVSLATSLAAPALATAARAALSGGSREAYDAAWASARLGQRARLLEVAGDAKFREAVTWQNRGAVVNGLDVLLRAGAKDDSRTRKKELLVASYLQRYAAKCDTIGFFGPVGWGGWSGQGGVVSQTPGATLVDARATHFEPWAMAALRDAVLAEPGVAEVVPLALNGAVRFERGRLVGEDADALDAVLASLINGQRSAVTIARVAAKRWPRRFTQAEALARLASLITRGIVRTAVPVAIELAPQRRLRAVAKTLVEPARAKLSTAVDSLDAARVAVEAAAGDPTALGTALEALDARFEALCGVSSRRNEGRTYGGRALVYEECRRSGSWTLGEELRAAVAEPLSLMLDLGRRLTSRVAQRFMRGVDQAFERLGGRRVSLVELWVATSALFDGAPPRAVEVEARALQDLFTRVAPLPEGDREARLSSAALRRALGRSLRVDSQAWPGARHMAPDLLLARRDGTWVPVLGELHVGVTPMTTLSVLAHCPVRAQLEALAREDLAGPHVTPIPWEDFARSTHDARLMSDASRWHLDLGFSFASPLPSKRVVPVGEVVVTRVAGELVASAKGRGFRAPLLDVLERRMKLRAASELDPFAWNVHRPRVWLDGLVVAREAWRIETAALSWAAFADARERFLGATRWQGEAGFPRHVFVRSPAEVKPMYVDFESPTLVEVLCKLIRGAPCLVVTEMLPAPEETWLEDASGSTYVSELRLVAVDAQPPRLRPGRRAE